MKKVKLEKMTVNGKELYYFNLGAVDYLKPAHRTFVHKDLIKFDNNGTPYIEFPMRQCDIIKKDSFNLILRPANKTVYVFEIEAGFRGTAYIDQVNTFEYEHDAILYEIYNSERGSTGLSKGVIITTNSDKVEIKWHRNGRLYGKPGKGITILYANGTTETIDRIDNIDDIINDLE